MNIHSRIKIALFLVFASLISGASFGQITIASIANPSRPYGTTNYLISSDMKEMGEHNYIFYTDSNKAIGYALINGVNEKLKVQKNGENMPIYTNAKYTVVINLKKTSQQTISKVEGMSDWDDWSYDAIEGGLTISDMAGKTVVKPFVGAILYSVKK